MKTKTPLILLLTLLLVGLAAFTTTGAHSVDESSPAHQLNDLEIAHIAYTADEIDIRYAHLALAISENPDVRAFAETMIRDHTAFNEKALELLEQLNVAPQDNPVSQELNVNAAKIRKELMQLEGRAFDRRYAENELAYHQFVNNAVETQFIPSVQTPELKAFLEAALQTFKVHERHAEEMVRNVNTKEM